MQAELSLTRFLALRLRTGLPAALPALARIPDAMVVTLLAKMSGMCNMESLENVAGCFAFLRLLPGHPDRGDG